MKKNIKPIKGQKQTQKQDTKKAIVVAIKPVQTVDTLTDEFVKLMAAEKYKSAYSVCIDLVRKTEEMAGFLSIETAFMYMTAGELAFMIKEYAAVTRLYSKVLTILDTIPADERFKLSEIHHNMGISYLNIKQEDKALASLLKAAHIFETKIETNDNDLAIIYTKIGEVYISKEDYQSAIKYLTNGVELYEKEPIQDTDLIALLYQNIGMCNFEDEIFWSAIVNFKKAIALLLPNKDKNYLQLGILYHNIGYAYYNQDKFLDTLKNYESSLLFFKQEFLPNSQMLLEAIDGYKDTYSKISRYAPKIDLTPHKAFLNTHFPNS